MTRSLTRPVSKHAILGVAIKRGEIVYFMPKPARHNDLIAQMAHQGAQTPIGHGTDVQGFMTAYGFMDRAWAADLIDHKGRLFSEDLW